MQRKKTTGWEEAVLDRRSFLRLCAVGAGGALIAACQPSLMEAVETSTPFPTATPSVKIRHNLQDQDAWTWVKQVQVGVSDGECERVIFRANGQEFEAQPDGDTYSADVRLAEGENQVRAVCILTGSAEVESEPVVFTGRLRQAPRAVIQIEVGAGQITLDGSGSLPAEGTQSAIVEYIWSAREANPASLPLTIGELSGEVSGQAISLAAPTADGEYYLNLRVVDEAGREDTSTTYFVVENGQPRIPDYDHENPAWLETAVVYGVIPFLFGSPAFQAVRERLDDLADLGINAIWLGPINQHPADDYGYAVEDYFRLDPSYGTVEDFRELVQTAHERGIRVLMDFVPNHTSDTHPYFLDAQERGPESPYWDFYDRDENGNYTYYFEWTNLPNLNYDHPEVRRMITEAFAYWVREFDVDGFRVDVVWGVKERRPDFWLDWRRELKRIKPDLMLLAEATARDPYYFENGFDVAYDWISRPGGWAWEVVWNAYKYRLLSYNMTTALTNPPDGYPKDAVIFRFINNNDTGKRFITRHGEGVARVATAMLLTLPGIPCLYTGDEYGLEFEPYQQVEPLTFAEQVPGLRDYHRRLIELRREIPTLRSRLWTPITTDPIPQSVFTYIRYSDQSGAPILVLLNFSEEPAEFRFDPPEGFNALPGGASLYDLLNEEEVPAFDGSRMWISVPGLTARVLAEAPIA
ncbi:MAG TPA: alpha-amylase family glycosyl hydrolase [Anaerolineales bacterium]|nr:alpha-amylase family glycosyl hydrolase [Anaerolineales bacterium]